MLDILSEESNIILESFLECYSKKSKVQYKSAINRFCNYYTIKSLSDITYRKYEDYNDNGPYLKWFMKYLYGYGHIKNTTGFPENWFKEEIVDHFNKSKLRLVNNNKSNNIKKEVRLNVSIICEIEEYFTSLTYDSNDIVYAFSWHMLFNTDCAVDELKHTEFKTFDGEYLASSEGTKYIIPVKFHSFINQRNATPNKLKFVTLDTYIRELGDKFGIDNLLPNEIKLARTVNIIKCPNCIEEYPAREGYWFLYQGRLVCSTCAELLKKNYKIIDISKVVDNVKESQSLESIDFESIEKFRKELGCLGEEFVYNYERKKLKGTEYYNLIDKTKALNPQNGYDILSYTINGDEIFIEVKTTLNSSKEFYITENELETARRLKKENKTYLIYRVSNIKDSETAELKIIEDLDNGKFSMKPLVYIVKEYNE